MHISTRTQVGCHSMNTAVCNSPKLNSRIHLDLPSIYPLFPVKRFLTMKKKFLSTATCHSDSFLNSYVPNIFSKNLKHREHNTLQDSVFYCWDSYHIIGLYLPIYNFHSILVLVPKARVLHSNYFRITQGKFFK